MGLEQELLHAMNNSLLVYLTFVVQGGYANEDCQVSGFILDVDRDWLKIQAEHTVWIHMNYLSTIELCERSLHS